MSNAPYSSSSSHRAVLKLGAAVLFALLLAFGIIVATVNAACEVESGQCRAPLTPRPIPSLLTALSYAQAAVASVPVFANTTDAALGLAPIRMLSPGFVWFSLANPLPMLVDNAYWYEINPDGYVRAEHVKLFQPSTFRGITLATPPDKPLAWIVYGARASFTPGKPPGKDSPSLSKYSIVSILEEKKVGEWIWYRIGENRWIEQRQLGIVAPSPRPAPVGQYDKWIDVNLFEQTLAAYEGDRMVYATLISSGLPQWSTPTGLFQVWAKVSGWKMSGREGLPDYYYLEDVPWILYFNKDVALHGAYWHDRFGSRRSHGCVNLSPTDAKWLFDWATPISGLSTWTLAKPDNPGTWVWVH